MHTQSLADKLGIKIRMLRKAAGLTQGQLAEIAEVSASFIGYIERGQQLPSLKIVERIAHGLKLPSNVLFDYSTETNALLEFAETEDDKRKHLYKALLVELHTCTLDDLHLLIQVAKHLGNKLLDQQSEEEEE